MNVKQKSIFQPDPGFADARHEAASQEDAVGGGEGLHRHHGENNFLRVVFLSSGQQLVG